MQINELLQATEGITIDGRYDSVILFFCESVVQCASYSRCALHALDCSQMGKKGAVFTYNHCQGRGA